MLAACEVACLQVCTGVSPGDQPAQPSLRPTRRTQATRPDHILANPQALPSLVDVRVNHLQRGSDHWPLEACLQLPWQVPTPVQCSGIPISQRKWRPAAQAGYVRSLQAQPALRASLDAAGRGDPTGSLQLLYTAICAAATASGMPARSGHRGTTVRRQHQPFFDRECQQLKRGVRQASATQRKRLERRYHALVRCKARRYKMDQLRTLLAGACLQKRSFWLALKRPGTNLQAALCSTQAWDGFIQRAANIQLPEGLHLSAAAYPSHPSQPAEALNEIDEKYK